MSSTLAADIEHLISQLGHEEYKQREFAYQEIKQFGFKSLAQLEKNTTNSDLEISLRCQEIINEYFYVTDKEGNVPSIWFLDNEIRFPKGLKITYYKGRGVCEIESEIDLSASYYESLRLEKNINLIMQGKNSCTLNDWRNFKIEEIDFQMQSWRDEELSVKATKIFIYENLKKGFDRNKMLKIIEKASHNSKKYTNCFQTKNQKDDYWLYPPGILIEKDKYKPPY